MKNLLFLVIPVLSVMAAACTKGQEDVAPIPVQAVEVKGGTMVVDGAAEGALLSLWSDRSGGDSESVWMVGGTRSEPLVFEVKGNTFKRHDTGLSRRLWWVTGVPGGSVFVVGEGGVTARYDGSTWTPLATDVPGTTLFGVWGTGVDNVWAVGGPEGAPGGGVTPEGNVILRYDGTSWARQSVPELDARPESAQKFLFKVWGADKDNVVVVGSSGLALHYDGAAWRVEPTGDTAGALFTVSGRSADDIWAIGGLNEMRLIHWDGGKWSQVPVGEFPPTITQGLFVAPGTGLVAGGISGYVAALGTDGSWVEPDPETAQGFHAVWVDGGGAFWAVGGDIVSLDPVMTAIYTTRQGLEPPVF